ncbi:MAG: hypothetical protein ABI960_04405 [Candidatus Eisenbacteria bacterium]
MKRCLGLFVLLATAIGGCSGGRPGGHPLAGLGRSDWAIAWHPHPDRPGDLPALSGLFAPGAQSAVAWLPDGTFWNGDCEFALFDGAGRAVSFSTRRAFVQGIPIAGGDAGVEDAALEAIAFLPWDGGDRDSLAWGLVSLVAGAPADRDAEVHFSFASRASGPRWRPIDPRAAAGDSFSYQFENGKLLRNGRLIGWLEGPSATPAGAEAALAPGDYGGRVTIRERVRRGESQEWRLWIAPLGGVPAGQRPGELGRSTRELLARTRRAWQKELARGIGFEIPDSTTRRGVDAAIALTVGSREWRFGGQRFPGNPFQYRDYYVRDGARVVRALNLVGRPDLAARALRNLFEFQWPGGAVLSQRGQLDGTGEALWAFGQYVSLARDRTVGRELLPSAERGAQWIRDMWKLSNQRGGIAAGLLPFSDPRDNENARGHLLGTDAWGLAGLAAVRDIEHMLGAAAKSEALAAAHVEGRARLLEVWAREASRQRHPLPAAVERGASDWANRSVAYPLEVLAPEDPRVRDLEGMARRGRYADGLPTTNSGDSLHMYLGFDLTQTALRRGDRSTVGADLAAELAHAQPDGSGGEVILRANHDFGENLPPHGTYAAMLIDLVRSMVVYERGDGLVLLAGVPPEWLAPGRGPIRMRHAPTSFGLLDLLAQSPRANVLHVVLTLPAPARMELPVEWTITEVTPSGARSAIRVAGRHAVLFPVGASTCDIQVSRPGERP